MMQNQNKPNWFYPYQKKWIEDPSNLLAWLKGRQIGGTESVAYKMVDRCTRSGIDQFIVSTTQRQANETLRSCDKYIEWYKNIYQANTGKPYKMLGSGKSFRLFPNGKKIQALAPKKDSIRGGSGDVYLDEFAWYKEAEEVYEAAFYISMRGFNLSVLSTPKGKSGLFYDILTNRDNNYKDFSRHVTNIYQAIKQGLKVDINRIIRNTDRESFLQECCCQFLDDLTAFFSWDLIRSCLDKEDSRFDASGEEIPIVGKNYMGVDVGRTHDLTVITVYTEKNDKFYENEMVTLRDCEYPVQESRIIEVFDKWNSMGGVEYVKIDQGSIGHELAERICKLIPVAKPVNMNIHFKKIITTNVKKLMEQKRLKIKDNKNHMTAIHSVQRKGDSFITPRNENGHGDEFWSTAIALSGVDGKDDNGLWWDHIEI